MDNRYINLYENHLTMVGNMFVVFDGLDGSGKGEMILRMHNYLFNKDKKISPCRSLITSSFKLAPYFLKVLWIES